MDFIACMLILYLMHKFSPSTRRYAKAQFGHNGDSKEHNIPNSEVSGKKSLTTQIPCSNVFNLSIIEFLT